MKNDFNWKRHEKAKEEKVAGKCLLAAPQQERKDKGSRRHAVWNRRKESKLFCFCKEKRRRFPAPFMRGLFYFA